MLSVTLNCVLAKDFVGNIYARKIFMGNVSAGNVEVMVFCGKCFGGKILIRNVFAGNIWQKCFLEGLNLQLF